MPLDLATQLRVLHKPSAAEMAAVSPYSIITGSGGSGKTMMMRHILISTIAERVKAPIFFELRQLNQSDETVRSALLRTIQSNGLDVDDEYFELALVQGHFSVMLDGFDELQHSHRKRVAREIQDLAERYPANWFVLSSRPDAELDGWGPFAQFRLQPLDLERAVELVEKLPFDDPVKDKFVADLRASLFQSHESFLSNPLLLSIMLLTYSDVAHIPNKLSIFYNQAYESLFQKHDALKGGFQRERRSGLDIQDFGRAFAAFCIQSYDARQFSFPQSRALELLDHGRRMTQLVYEPQALLTDALQAVCLLVEEGMEIAFAHRSFQEYFAARFIHLCQPNVKPKLIRRLAPAAQSDTVMALLHELDPFAVEQHYVLPAIEKIKRRIRLVHGVGVSHFLRYIRCLYQEFRFDPDEGQPRVVALIASGELHAATRFIMHHYASQVETVTSSKWLVGRDLVEAAFGEEFGEEGSASTASLTTKSKFVRALFESSGPWGADRLRSLLSVESLIIRRQEDSQSSLEEILTTGR